MGLFFRYYNTVIQHYSIQFFFQSYRTIYSVFSRKMANLHFMVTTNGLKETVCSGINKRSKVAATIVKVSLYLKLFAIFDLLKSLNLGSLIIWLSSCLIAKLQSICQIGDICLTLIVLYEKSNRSDKCQ